MSSQVKDNPNRAPGAQNLQVSPDVSNGLNLCAGGRRGACKGIPSVRVHQSKIVFHGFLKNTLTE